MRRIGLAALVAFCCALVPVQGALVADTAPLPWASVLALLPQMAGSPGTDRATVAFALNEFMAGLVDYLETQGVPAEELGQIQDRFAFALGKFLSAGSAAAFGEDIARLARELAVLAAEGGVEGPPAALLERIGIATWAIEALRNGAQELTGLEVAAIARQIAGQALANGGAPGQGNVGVPGQAAGDVPFPTLPGAGSNPPIPPIPEPPTIGGPPVSPGPPPGLPPVVPGPPEDEDPPPPRGGR